MNQEKTLCHRTTRNSYIRVFDEYQSRFHDEMWCGRPSSVIVWKDDTKVQEEKTQTLSSLCIEESRSVCSLGKSVLKD